MFSCSPRQRILYQALRVISYHTGRTPISDPRDIASYMAVTNEAPTAAPRSPDKDPLQVGSGPQSLTNLVKAEVPSPTGDGLVEVAAAQPKAVPQLKLRAQGQLSSGELTRPAAEEKNFCPLCILHCLST